MYCLPPEIIMQHDFLFVAWLEKIWFIVCFSEFKLLGHLCNLEHIEQNGILLIVSLIKSNKKSVLKFSAQPFCKKVNRKDSAHLLIPFDAINWLLKNVWK